MGLQGDAGGGQLSLQPTFQVWGNVWGCVNLTYTGDTSQGPLHFKATPFSQTQGTVHLFSQVSGGAGLGQGQTLEQQHLERASGVICVAYFWLLAGEFNSWRYHDRPTQPHADLPFSPLLPHLCRGRNVPSSAGH